MRILWISNVVLGGESSGSGSWLHSMSQQLCDDESIVLANAIPVPSSCTVIDAPKIRQWALPEITRGKTTALSRREALVINEIIAEFNPDLIHIWGVENGWGLLSKYVDIPVLLEIQGIRGEIYKYMYGMLSFSERLRAVSLKEILRFKTLGIRRKEMLDASIIEDEIIAVNKYFGTPTEWMKGNVIMRNPKAICFDSQLQLRQEFYEAKKWSAPKSDGEFTILTSGSAMEPYKGIHILIKALAKIKSEIPTVKLKIVGKYSVKGIKASGYARYLRWLVSRLGLEENVIFLGALTAEQIISELHSSNVYVLPSFIESAGMTLLEAQELGVPVIASYTGGIPFLGGDSVEYFSIGDYYTLAYMLLKQFRDNRCKKGSKVETHEPFVQQDLYKEILSRENEAR